ncbi:MAG TPA: ABC transporter ATP-binding protein [Anaerolineales bacterium]|nr:ABC transporter ATP-binding protein [Anaerolineales bacterium]
MRRQRNPAPPSALGAPSGAAPSAPSGAAPGATPKAAGYLVRAIRYIRRYRRDAVLAYGALFIATAAQLMVPQLVQNIIDAVTQGMIAGKVLELPAAVQSLAAEKLGLSLDELLAHRNGAESALLWAGALIVVFAALRGLFAFAQTYMGERLSQSVAFDLRNDLFAKIQRLSFSYHDQNRTGQLMVRATDDVEKVRLFIGQGLLMAVQALALLTGTLAVLLATNARLMLVALPILPIALLMFGFFGSVTRPLFEKVQRLLSNMNTILQENVAGIKVVKAFTREDEQDRRFAVAADKYMRQQLVVSRIMSFLFPLVFLVASLGQALILNAGGRQIIQGTLTLGEWQKFSLYLVYVFFPLGMLGMIIAQMSQASASARRVFEILDAQSDIVDKPGAVDTPPLRGHVRFENVTFRYFGSGEAVLSEVDFEAQPGQTVALLGATGSGKSTIINLIPRFYDATEGRVLIDGLDVRDVKIESLRSQIGIVLQDTTLFSGTIRDNIAFGRTGATDAEIERAAGAAAADTFIRSFPDGYATLVGERGTTLSGGQKQRLAIARSLLMDPRILILDDSTSSVDLATEAEIQKALSELMRGRTSFVIAQRISTVLNADQILVLDRGRIAARGRHEELLESSELYAGIYSSQLVDDARPVPAPVEA